MRRVLPLPFLTASASFPPGSSLPGSADAAAVTATAGTSDRRPGVEGDHPIANGSATALTRAPSRPAVTPATAAGDTPATLPGPSAGEPNP